MAKKDPPDIIPLNGLEHLHAVLDALLPKPDTGDDENPDLTNRPPQTTPNMFPGLLQEIVDACCKGSEAVPIAVASNCLLRFAALVGPGVYLPIGDEKRQLNEFVLMIGPTGLGKGGSHHGPKRLFNKVEEYLQLDLDRQVQVGKSCGITRYPFLNVHNGGFSSGEGLAATLNDNGINNEPSVTDKRLLVFEPEFSNVMSMCQRGGNTLSVVLRNVYDGINIKPMTKRDKVQVTNPHVCLLANITDHELKQHDQSDMMSSNGMLNRFLILWQQPDKELPFPDPIPEPVLNSLADLVAKRILQARKGSHETHYRKVQENAWPVTLDDQARSYWSLVYSQLLNRPDSETVKSMTRRHRLHALLLAAIFALFDGRDRVQLGDMKSAMTWINYSQRSVIYAFKSTKEEMEAREIYQLARRILYAVVILNARHGQCTRTDIHNFYQRKLKGKNITRALESLFKWIPPLIKSETVILQSGRNVPSYQPTDKAIDLLNQRGAEHEH